MTITVFIKPMPKMSEAEVSRFWDNVPSRGSDGCWEWTGDCVPGGYGRFRTAGKNYAAHRLSMSIANKEIDSKFACHTCDNRKCVNPDHLYPGDNITNAQDRTIRKRKPSQNKHRVGFCRNPECELPECVSAASAGEKVIASVRGVIPSICKHGHILTGINTYVSPKGFWACRTCQAATAAKYKAKKLSKGDSR